MGTALKGIRFMARRVFPLSICPISPPRWKRESTLPLKLLDRLERDTLWIAVIVVIMLDGETQIIRILECLRLAPYCIPLIKTLDRFHSADDIWTELGRKTIFLGWVAEQNVASQYRREIAHQFFPFLAQTFGSAWHSARLPTSCWHCWVSTALWDSMTLLTNEEYSSSMTAQFEHTIYLGPLKKEVVSRGEDYWDVQCRFLKFPVVYLYIIKKAPYLISHLFYQAVIVNSDVKRRKGAKRAQQSEPFLIPGAKHVLLWQDRVPPNLVKRKKKQNWQRGHPPLVMAIQKRSRAKTPS